MWNAFVEAAGAPTVRRLGSEELGNMSSERGTCVLKLERLWDVLDLETNRQGSHMGVVLWQSPRLHMVCETPLEE